MYPNVPMTRVGFDTPPTLDSLVNPKSATYNAIEPCEKVFEDP
jgi:hypothetical protein